MQVRRSSAAIDILVNNAASPVNKLLALMTEKDWDDVMDRI